MHTIFLKKETGLIRAFEPPRGVTALVGGGGKTTLMLQLARELAEGGARVIVTTTTHIFPPDGIPLITNSSEEAIRAALAKNPLICVGSPAKEGKLVPAEVPVSQLAALADYVIAEADGAKRLPLKAPASHEPVIPQEARLVIAVAGLDGAERPIRETAFRPDLYAILCGKTLDDCASARDIALVLASPNGQRKGVKNDMRFAVLLNKAKSDPRRETAFAIAGELEQYSVERVVIAALGVNDEGFGHAR